MLARVRVTACTHAVCVYLYSCVMLVRVSNSCVMLVRMRVACGMCIPACGNMKMCVHMHACSIYIHMHAYIGTQTHICAHTYMHTYLPLSHLLGQLSSKRTRSTVREHNL